MASRGKKSAAQHGAKKAKPDQIGAPAITAISLKGFKSFADETRLEIRPLTLLAGANSSGKSSALQPLLLLKQTFEAPYDPGPLLLDGPHVRFTSLEQMFTRIPERAPATEFQVVVEYQTGDHLRHRFATDESGQLELRSLETLRSGHKLELSSRLTALQPFTPKGLVRALWSTDNNSEALEIWRHLYAVQFLAVSVFHVPGLRGNPVRSYPTTVMERFLEGTFEPYVASLLEEWGRQGDERITRVHEHLSKLGLSSIVLSQRIDAARLEILVGRLPGSKKVDDLVNIADVGFGVSQVLPVVVALAAPQPGRLVYLEQPELHLHPRAQAALAEVLADAARRGVRVVAETHSSTLLLAVQALVAEGKLPTEDVILHWFQRDADGVTRVTSAELDQLGAYGDWPEDFGEVESAVQNRYLDAVESRTKSRKAK